MVQSRDKPVTMKTHRLLFEAHGANDSESTEIGRIFPVKQYIGEMNSRFWNRLWALYCIQYREKKQLHEGKVH